MIISRTPYRISFFGGGTDYPAWYHQHGGAVLAASVDKYCYLTCRYLPPFFEHRIRLVYSKIESCWNIDEIQHPAIRETLRFMNVDKGVEIHHDGDLPARSGMGTSSSFTVGLLHALHALQGRMVSKHQLATEGIHLEQNVLKESVGSQDQVMAAYGGLNYVRFLPDGEIVVRPLTIPRSRVDELNQHLMLFYTGIKRTASSVASSYVNGLSNRRSEFQKLGEYLEEGVALLESPNADLTPFGRLLHDAWMIKRNLSGSVSNSIVDLIYDRARQNGAIGGKLLGAGGGGFVLLFVPPDCRQQIRAALADFICVPTKIEFSGSQIILFNPESEYAEEQRGPSLERMPVFRELDENLSLN